MEYNKCKKIASVAVISECYSKENPRLLLPSCGLSECILSLTGLGRSAVCTLPFWKLQLVFTAQHFRTFYLFLIVE